MRKVEAQLLSIKGEPIRRVELPPIFQEAIRTDIIKRAVISHITARLQPWGANPLAGMRTTAETWGKGRGVARVPRIKTGRRAALVPHAVGGRRAHPPTPQKILHEKINAKERKLAIRSAIAATAKKELVSRRGHRFDMEKVDLPIILEEKFETLRKTAEIAEVLKNIGVWDDILRSKSKKIRAGKGKMRGRKYKRKKGPLIVISGDNTVTTPAGTKPTTLLAARNLPGIDVCIVHNLNAEILAPGAAPGRLTIYSEPAIEKLREENLFW